MKDPARLIAAWRDGRIPAVDAITHRTGRVVLMTVRHFDVDGREQIRVQPLADTTIDSLMTYDPDGWCTVEPLARRARAIVGEGALGSDGFAALESGDGGILWTAFFSTSEAFIDVHLTDAHLVARSASGHRWIFPLEAPERVSVEAAPPSPLGRMTRASEFSEVARRLRGGDC